MGIEFNSSRLRLARERRGLTKAALAKAAGVSARLVSMYENCERDEPSDESLQRFSRVLGFPVEFFRGDDVEELDPNIVSFRSMSKMKAAQRNAALSAARLALLVNDWIDVHFELPTPNLLDLRGELPEGAAESIRTHWGLGVRSIRNIVHLLEANGVRVFSLRQDDQEVDAFSFWNGNTPFVFLNTIKSAERSRFDAAHELGHLLLHRHGAAQGKEIEQEANRFASAFLMPSDSVYAVAPRLPCLEHLIQLKKHWLVSVSALIRRLKDLELITEWHYRSLCIDVTQQGYRKNEPEGIQRETSQILNKVFSALREEGITKGNLARDLDLPVEEIESLVFNLAVVGLQGQGTGKTNGPKNRPALKLVI